MVETLELAVQGYIGFQKKAYERTIFLVGTLILTPIFNQPNEGLLMCRTCIKLLCSELHTWL